MKKSTKKILDEIELKRIKIKPKAYFKLLKTLTLGVSILLVIFTVVLFNIMFYLPTRMMRIVGESSPKEYLALFPWPLILAGGVTIGTLVFIYRKYEGGYKKRLLVTIGVVFLGLLFFGAALAKSNVNDLLEKRDEFKKIYEWQEENFIPQGRGKKYRRYRIEQKLNSNIENTDKETNHNNESRGQGRDNPPSESLKINHNRIFKNQATNQPLGKFAAENQTNSTSNNVFTVNFSDQKDKREKNEI